jgi:hypothetical protein
VILLSKQSVALGGWDKVAVPIQSARMDRVSNLHPAIRIRRNNAGI